MTRVRDVFHGDGFETGDFSDQERAEIRHMINEYAPLHLKLKKAIKVWEVFPLNAKILGWAVVFGASLSLIFGGKIPKELLDILAP